VENDTESWRLFGGESMTEKLDQKLDKVKIKQTSPIRFND
jgi:hypothetical protein